MRNRYVPANGVTYRAGNVASSIKIRTFWPCRPLSAENCDRIRYRREGDVIVMVYGQI